MRRVYSSRGLSLTKTFESLRTAAYQDGAGVWTIGYGHTGADVAAGHTVTPAEADILLASDVAAAVTCVNAAVTAAINQNQFDALVDFAFNCGRHRLLTSTLLVDVNNGDFADAAEQFGRWIYAGGEIEQGLVRRRAAEAALFQEAA